MNIRKAFLILGCLMSGVGLFLPMYTLTLNGQPVEGGSVTLIGSFYGILIILADIVVIGSAIFGVKKGYVIASLISVGATAYSVISTSIGQAGAWAIINTTSKYLSQATNERYDYRFSEGPGFVLLVLAAVVILLTMIWNALNNEN